MSRPKRATGPTLDRHFSVSTTQKQVASLDGLRTKYGLRSRSEVARRAIDLGLAALERELARSTLTAGSA